MINSGRCKERLHDEPATSALCLPHLANASDTAQWPVPPGGGHQGVGEILVPLFCAAYGFSGSCTVGYTAKWQPPHH